MSVLSTLAPLFIALGLWAAVVPAASANQPADPAPDPAGEIVALYERFAEAQNRRDPAAVRALLLSSERFLWVSDGKAYWGPDTMVERMIRFQKAELWRVEPDRARRRIVAISADRAHLFQPLVLRIGAAAAPDAIPFLVSVLCVRTADGWRIAGLLTTVEKP